jgi:ubiquinone/menaquinone biosynthesis C-methylase UbiE
VINPYAVEGIGSIYVRGRPFYHEDVLGRMLQNLGLMRVDLGADIACGTGLSTRALLLGARSVIGIDISEEMLMNTFRDPRVAHVLGSAESLPFSSNTFGALTVSSGLHWLEDAYFLSEARRVLLSGAWMAMYDYLFMGAVEDSSAFDEWIIKRYVTRFPTSGQSMKAKHYGEATTLQGFVRLGGEGYEYVVQFTRDDLASYLLTEGGTVVTFSHGTEAMSDVYDWLRSEVALFFDGDQTRPFKEVRIIPR